MKILILGGTGHAVELANELVEQGHAVITSLAGRTKNPTRAKGKLVSGGFGGIEGLANFLKKNAINYIIDSTHAFTQTMSASAVDAANIAKVPLLRLVRPPFEEPEGSGWWRAKNPRDAARLLPTGAGAFLTLGRQTLKCFIERHDVRFLVRSIEKPGISLPENFISVQARPPFSRADEVVLMKRNGITHLVTKDSGSAQTQAKLGAAFMLRVQVIMIRRPKLKPCREVATVAEVVEIIAQLPAPKRKFFFLP